MGMIERATAAIVAELYRQAESTGCTTESDGARVQVDGSFDVAQIARAVIAAIHEPTEEMNNDVAPDRPHADCLRAGIDAALGDVRNV